MNELRIFTKIGGYTYRKLRQARIVVRVLIPSEIYLVAFASCSPILSIPLEVRR
jgi:hypothetical protein